jgi:membrane-associated protease RseP (regulator of RpoE activity)
MQPSHRRIFVFRRWEDCPPGITSERALIEVPGEWAHHVVALVKSSQEFRHSGLLVTNIGPGSQAARAGMQCGDVLLRFGGQELDSAATLRRLTKTYSHGTAAQKPTLIEAARGAEDIEFEVFGGKLGITVSPSLYRNTVRKPRWQRVLGEMLGIDERPHRVLPHVVHTVEEARRHNPESPALAVVPGDLARPVLGVLRALEHGSSSKRRKRAKSLLVAAARLG